MLALLSGCPQQPRQKIILFDFESDADLDRLRWNCRTLYSLSTEHVTHGTRSLKLELFPSDYPGLLANLSVTDWRGFTTLSFDIYNPSAEPVQATVHIDDRKESYDYGERFNKRFALSPGPNRVVIPLGQMFTSGSGRLLHAGHITRFLVYVPNPVKPITLYLDHILLS